MGLLKGVGTQMYVVFYANQFYYAGVRDFIGVFSSEAEAIKATHLHHCKHYGDKLLNEGDYVVDKVKINEVFG